MAHSSPQGWVWIHPCCLSWTIDAAGVWRFWRPGAAGDPNRRVLAVQTRIICVSFGQTTSHLRRKIPSVSRVKKKKRRWSTIHAIRLLCMVMTADADYEVYLFKGNTGVLFMFMTSIHQYTFMFEWNESFYYFIFVLCSLKLLVVGKSTDPKMTRSSYMISRTDASLYIWWN